MGHRDAKGGVRRAWRHNPVPRAYLPMLRLWTLRLIGLLGGPTSPYLLLLGRHQFEIFTLASLPQAREAALGPLKAEEEARFRWSFEAAWERAEAASAALPTMTTLARNLRDLGSSAGLGDVEVELLHLVVLSRLHPGLGNAFKAAGDLSSSALIHLLSRVLGIPGPDLTAALSPKGALARTGLLTLDQTIVCEFAGKLELPGSLADQLTLRHRSPASLFASAFTPSPRARLTLQHFPHLARDLAILEPFLRSVLDHRRCGVNIFIHGAPGTGKTELVRALAAQMRAELHEVASTLPDGNPLAGIDRFGGYRLAQAVLAGRAGSLLLFDEVEDVFRPVEDVPTPARGGRANANGLKAWVNRLLEENPVPAFWVSNRLHALDPAFIRRFDLVLELRTPPRSVRRRILEDHLGKLPLAPECLDQHATHVGLTPALIAKAAGMLEEARRADRKMDLSGALDRLVDRGLATLGHASGRRDKRDAIPRYRPEVLNLDVPLEPLLEGLRRHGSGRLCFAGPPGTGKTALAHHLAEQLDRPLLARRASDLLDCYLGRTEQRLAAMFEEAREEGAVLLLDEADSFLQDRAQARNTWEVTQVNEMLTQMEAFDGIFIASTNLLDAFDPAAIRRFDTRVKFGFLKPEQAALLFKDAVGSMGLPLDEGIARSLTRLRLLTLGDFATVLRQVRLNPAATAEVLLGRLELESLAKPTGHRRSRLGFSE